MKNNTAITLTIVVVIIATSFFIANKLDFNNQITANTVRDDGFMEGKQIVNIK